MRVIFSLFLFVHAAAHAVGALSVSGIVAIEDVSGEPTLLLTGFEQDHWVMRVMALLWLVALAGFAVAGLGVLVEASWTVPALLAATALSLALCVIWARDVPFGFAANAIVLAALAIPAISDRVLPT